MAKDKESENEICKILSSSVINVQFHSPNETFHYFSKGTMILQKMLTTAKIHRQKFVR